MGYVYTWVDGSRFCDADSHHQIGVCDDCCDNDDCAACGQRVADGARYLYCTDNGEIVHAGCDPSVASADWVDYY